MFVRIAFQKLPQGKDLMEMRGELDGVLGDDGWLIGSGEEAGSGWVELELEDEKMNPKYGILALKDYLQKAGFAPQTTMEFGGAAIGIFE